MLLEVFLLFTIVLGGMTALRAVVGSAHPGFKAFRKEIIERTEEPPVDPAGAQPTDEEMYEELAELFVDLPIGSKSRRTAIAMLDTLKPTHDPAYDPAYV